METDINSLAPFALNIDEVRANFAPDVVAKFEAILDFAQCAANDLLAVQNDVELIAETLTSQLIEKYPLLSAASIKSVLVYVHFYICR